MFDAIMFSNLIASDKRDKHYSVFLGHADVNITYNLYIHLYGDGFDEMYEALVGNV